VNGWKLDFRVNFQREDQIIHLLFTREVDKDCKIFWENLIVLTLI